MPSVTGLQSGMQSKVRAVRMRGRWEHALDQEGGLFIRVICAAAGTSRE